MEELKVTAGALSMDFEQLRNEVESTLSFYKGLVFTEESKKPAKDTVADLRKKKKELTDALKDAKKAYMVPFDEFSKKAEEIILLYDEPIGFILEQIDVFEASRIEEKKKVIQEIYLELNGDMAHELPLEKIYNKKWENATFKPNDIRKEIMERRQAAKAAVESIRCFGSEVEDKAIAIYFETLELTEAVHFMRAYEDQKKEILAREGERVAANVQESIVSNFVPDNSDNLETVIYSIKLNADGKEKLEMFMNSVGIEFEEVVF